MPNNQVRLTRNDITRIVGNDLRLIKAFEELFISSGGGAWINLDFTGSSLLDIESRNHIDLQNIEGAVETSTNTSKTKHVSDNQLKVNADRFTIVTTSTSINAGSSQIILADASLGNLTVSLPLIADSAKRRYIIKKIDSTSNSVIVDGSGSETIDGELTMIINTQYDAMQIIPSGTDWGIV